MPTTHAYIIMGSAGSGRRVVIADLLLNGLGSDARPVMLVAEGEAPEAEKSRLGEAASLICLPWRIADGRVVAGELPDGATHVFILLHGRQNPVDQIEALHEWLPGAGLELARILTVVDCKLASAHPELLRWFDACVHFSDVVLLSRREGVTNKWISDFVARYRKQHYPCLIEPVKGGELENPALVLEPQARRISMLFDADGQWEDGSVEGGGDGEDDDEDEDSEESAADAGDGSVGVDPYLERLAGSGRREREIPDIARFL